MTGANFRNIHQQIGRRRTIAFWTLFTQLTEPIVAPAADAA
jgi:hypothetical protein